MAEAISTGVAQLESPQRVVLVTSPAQDIIMIYCCETSMSHKCETQDTWVVCLTFCKVRPRHVSACLTWLEMSETCLTRLLIVGQETTR
jgi:hypothetical protein